MDFDVTEIGIAIVTNCADDFRALVKKWENTYNEMMECDVIYRFKKLMSDLDLIESNIWTTLSWLIDGSANALFPIENINFLQKFYYPLLREWRTKEREKIINVPPYIIELEVLYEQNILHNR